MKNIFFFLVTLSCIQNVAKAQGENNIWTFGKGMGLDFNSGKPVPIGSALFTTEGSASVSGKNGMLKFYSDGVHVFNRENKQMPNGYGLLTNLSITQGVVIVPFVDDTNKYYLFVLHSTGFTEPCFLNYSVIDMTLEGGLGDILPSIKNIQIDDSLSEKMVVTRSFGCGFWLITRKRSSPSFRCFKISAKGLSVKPVTTTTDYIGTVSLGIGEMKVAPDNKMVVLANWDSRGKTGSIELFDFDNVSGLFSNYRLIDSSKRYAAYGVEFSSDSKKLYAAYGEDEPRPPYPLVQFDLNLLGDIPAMRLNRTVLSEAYNWAGMRSFRGKIYVVKSGGIRTTICVINNPDVKGLACGFKDSLIIYNEGSFFGLGNPVPETKPDVITRRDTVVCNPITCSGVKGFQQYLWSDGYNGYDRRIDPPALLWVKSFNSSCEPAAIDTIGLSLKPFDLDLGHDQVLCTGQTAIVECNLGGAQYLWSDGSRHQAIEIDKAGSYFISVREGDCFASDTINVKFQNCANCITLPNSFTPNRDGINDLFRPIIICKSQKYELKIFNRYGQQVFGSTDAYAGWDGTFNGEPLDLGVYYYMLKVQFDKPDAIEEFFKGDITPLK